MCKAFNTLSTALPLSHCVVCSAVIRVTNLLNLRQHLPLHDGQPQVVAPLDSSCAQVPACIQVLPCSTGGDLLGRWLLVRAVVLVVHVTGRMHGSAVEGMQQ